MNGFQVGQKVAMLVEGAGVVSKEDHEVADIENGVISLVHSEKKFDLQGKWLGKDEFFGFKFSIQ